METPSSSTRRVTRSQTLVSLNNNSNNNIPISRKIEESDKGLSKSRKRTATATTKQQDRSVALIDITNDSPIVGLAMGSLETPSSGVAKQRSFRGTPGSGENLLRGQVKTLLQRVEEEAELSKLSLERRPFLHHLQGPVNTPLQLLAPTPANTPLILNLSGDDVTDNNGLTSMNPSPVTYQQLISQEVVVSDIFDVKKKESIEYEKNLTRSLLLDFSEKLEFSFSSSPSSECSSVVTDQSSKEKSSITPDDDDSSIWSIQGNASSTTHGEDVDEVIEVDAEEEEEEDGLLDELCEGVSRISVNTTTSTSTIAKFAGKHTRFMYKYNSDGEEIVEESDDGGLSPNVLRLQGLPTPKGKHLRFPTEEEGSDDR
ncbi:hypothetical protein LWI28_011339 [Acer negundo]|uniref:Uncharacterized protein n=1 Tax=Acer negundo TaxID=4023 RepID=A0AAD5NKR3_ACENE|nr:hypothetical protein LWI28_011339 [Acer negundo]KAK4843995.1 hypothetical protein QYF36_015145 [Acer negundo]